MRSHSLCGSPGSFDRFAGQPSRPLAEIFSRQFPGSQVRRFLPADSPGPSFRRSLPTGLPVRIPARSMSGPASIPDRSATTARFRRLIPTASPGRFSRKFGSLPHGHLQKNGSVRKSAHAGPLKATAENGRERRKGQAAWKREVPVLGNGRERRKGPGSPPTVPNATGKPLLYGRRHSAGTGTGFHLPSMASRGKATSLPA